jgi:ABC-type sugar transport system substrate-binding protein
MPDKEWIVVSKKYLDDSMVNEEAQTITSIEENTPSDHERAEVIRKLMEQNQGLYADVLASIPDNEILEATVGNVTNSQVAQTADNLIRKYPDLKP